MQSTILALAAVFGLVSAAPAMETREITGKFGLTVLATGTKAHFAPLQAYQSAIFAGTAAQNATCDTPANYATFALSAAGGELQLYSTDAPFQVTYVDASGMGQGIFQYTTGAQPTSANGQRTPFALGADNTLTFNGKGFRACPYDDAGANFVLWADAGVANPGGYTGCFSVTLLATEIPAPISCQYSF